MRIILTLLFITFAMPLTLASDAKDSTSIDLRQDKSAPGNYNVAFAARGDGELGHAFVILFAEDDDSRTSVDIAFGLYPVGEKKWTFGPMVGSVLEERLADRQKITHRLDVRIDKAVYQKLAGYIKRAKAKKDQEWILLSRDCVTFTRECAAIVGLKIPLRGVDGPEEAVDALIERNSGK